MTSTAAAQIFRGNLKCQILKGPFWCCFWPASRLDDGRNDHAEVLEERGSQISREADGSAHSFAPQEGRERTLGRREWKRERKVDPSVKHEAVERGVRSACCAEAVSLVGAS